MRRRRAGSLMIESLAAVSLLALALVGVSQLLVSVGRQQRVLETRRAANLALANLMEYVMALPDDELTPERLAGISESVGFSPILVDAQASFQVRDSDEQPAGRQIEIEVTWRGVIGDRERVNLTAWRYPEASPP